MGQAQRVQQMRRKYSRLKCNKYETRRAQAKCLGGHFDLKTRWRSEGFMTREASALVELGFCRVSST